jgi:hypothetical protein
MWPILVEKPDGPWSNYYGGLGLGPPHHRQRHLCLPSSTLGLHCPKIVFFQCCPQIMHKICSCPLPKHWFFVSFGIRGMAKWVLGLGRGFSLPTNLRNVHTYIGHLSTYLSHFSNYLGYRPSHPLTHFPHPSPWRWKELKF